MITRFLLPLLLFGGSFFLYGQTAWTVYTETNSPLPLNTVRCIAVDHLNNKWIGTDYGLAKYDNSFWTVYNTSNSQLPDNNIRAIACDQNGNVWIGTQSGGLARLNGTAWTIYNTSNSGIPGNFVRAITIGPDGNIWLGSSAGLVKFDGTTWTSWNNTNSPLISHHVTSVAVSADSALNIGTINGGFVVMKDTSFSFYNLWNNKLPDNTILSIALDTAGNRWIAMPSGGLAVDYGGGTWQGFTTLNSSIVTDALNTVFVDTRNTIYAGSQDKGLLIRQGFEFSHYDSLNSDLPDVNVLSITKDKDNIVWIGTMYGGLARLDETLLTIRENIRPGFRLINNITPRGGEIRFISDSFDGLEVRDLHGRSVLNIKGSIGDGYIETENLLPGMYFVISSNRSTVHRFIVQ